MSTRAIVRLIDKKGPETGLYAVIYHHYDGYPEHRGVEIARYLESGTMVNGITHTETDEVVWNGFGCFAASYIDHFKDGLGNTYLLPATWNQDAWQDYEYNVWHSNGEWKIVIIALNNREMIFRGTPAELIAQYGQKENHDG